MLATMRANSAGPSPIPECSSACAGTLPTAPPALTLVYPDIVRCERVAVAAVVWNLDGGNLAAAVNARERNDECVISRNRAPATIPSRGRQLTPQRPVGDSKTDHSNRQKRRTGLPRGIASTAEPPRLGTAVNSIPSSSPRKLRLLRSLIELEKTRQAVRCARF